MKEKSEIIIGKKKISFLHLKKLIYNYACHFQKNEMEIINLKNDSSIHFVASLIGAIQSKCTINIYDEKEVGEENLFNSFFEKNEIAQILFFYTIVPVNSTYLNIIIQNINLLEDAVAEEDLINYLKQVNKMKSWTRSHMQNSDLLLREEVLFTEIYKKVNSLSLQLKLKVN